MAIINPILENSEDIASNPTGYTNSAIQTVISLLLIFGVIYFIFHFVLAGYHMISSQGDPKKYEEAWHGFLYSLIGIAVIFSVFLIIKLIGAMFGITGLENLTIAWPSI